MISLLDYRRKKQKRISKTVKKAASDKEEFFIDKENSAKAAKEKLNSAPIYYMGNYSKTKKLPSLEKEKSNLQNKQHEIKERENILDLKTHRKMNTKNYSQKKNFVSKLISLESYRKLKSHKINSSYYPKYAKEAVSLSVIALMMLFALNVFFPNKGLFNFKKDQPQYAQRGKLDNTADRRIASEHSLKKEETERINNGKRPEGQPAFFGERPNSSDYTGF